MKSRTVLNIALFIAIAAAVLSFVGFILAFVVKGEQVYANGEMFEKISAKEML